VADIEVEQSGTTIPIGIIDEPELTVSSNVEQLRGAGPVTWQDLQRTELQVNVTGTVAEWDLDTWKTLVGYDEAQDQLLTGADVPTWTTTVIYEDTSGDTAAFPVQECYTEDVTVGGSREEWIGMDLDFTGQTIQNVMSESTTAGST
jgi:hypothetical protein